MTTQVVLHVGGPGKRDCKFDFVQFTRKMYSIYNYLNDETMAICAFHTMEST